MLDSRTMPFDRIHFQNSPSKFGETMKIMLGCLTIAAISLLIACTQICNAQTTVRHIQEDDRPIARGVWAGDTLYLSGQLANPVTAADPAKGTAVVYGDTETQTMSTLTKIQDALKKEGLTMADVVMMHVFLVGDPAKGGKLDFPGMMASYTKFFGTKDQPNKPARSAMQVAALAAPWAMVEIEVIAVKGSGKPAR
jgi:enamine deaminase RidA (YjgF/YER057c/UK114 family)